MAGGQDISVFDSKTARRLVRAMRLIESFRMTGAVTFHKGKDTMSAHVPGGQGGGGGVRRLPVRLSGRGTVAGFYQFAEQEWVAGSSRWQDKTGGLTHSDLGEALEVSLRRAIPLGRTNLVYLQNNGLILDSSGQAVWNFQSPIKWIWASLTGSTLISTNRWKMAWTEQIRTASGFGAPTWTALSGTTTTDFAINSIEAGNNGSGVEGHSVDVNGADYPAGFSVIAPDVGGAVVQIYEEVLDNDSRAFTIQKVNADDGTCT